MMIRAAAPSRLVAAAAARRSSLLLVRGAASASPSSSPPASIHRGGGSGSGRCRCLRWREGARGRSALNRRPDVGIGAPDASLLAVRRSFRSTPRKEIVPLLGAAAVVAVVARYGYRALKRMEGEWDDYQWELRRYEKAVARGAADGGGGDAGGAGARTVVAAVDAGTLFAKVAVGREIVPTREGDRAAFAGVAYEEPPGGTGGALRPALRGRQALERYFYERKGDGGGGDSCEVVIPWTEMVAPRGGDSGGAGGRPSPADALYDSAAPALREALERTQHAGQGPAVRVVVAAPSGEGPAATARLAEAHAGAFGRCVSEGEFRAAGPAVILPDSVAATWGAQLHGLLPDDDDGEGGQARRSAAASPSSPGSLTLVVDAGALASQVSVVRRDVVLSSASIPWGGENWIRSAVELLLRDSPAPTLQDARSLSALQVQARASVAELSSKPRVSVHVPYLFPDPRNHHLDASLARSVLEQAVADDIRRGLAWSGPWSGGGDATPPCFSPHFPPPTDLASMWMSCITTVLERGQLLPTDVDRVLLVGGGARPPAVARSVKAALFGLLGSDAAVASRVVVPEPALQGELAAIGASTMLPSFEYHPEHGLQRAAS